MSADLTTELAKFLAVRPLGSGGSLIHQASRTLTHGEIRDSPTTAIQIAAAPGANKILYPQFAAFHLNWFGDYASIDGAATFIIAAGTQGLTITLNEAVSGGVTNLLAGGEAANASVVAGFTISAGAIGGLTGMFNSDVVNKALNVRAGNAGNFTAGHASNTLIVLCEFRVMSLVTGLFLTPTESGWDQTTRTFA